MLAELRRPGFVLIAETNCNSTLEQYEFIKHLALVHQAERAGISKPDQRFYLDALKRAGASVESTISAGDRMGNDIDGPRGIEMDWIFLDRANGAADVAVARITTLRELANLLVLA